MPLTLVSLETQGLAGLADRELAFNARGLSFVMAPEGAAKRCLLQSMAVCFGALPLSALANGTPRSPFLRMSLVGDSLVELQVHSADPTYQVVFQPGDQKAVFSQAHDMLDLLQTVARIPSLRVPFVSSLGGTPFVFPPDLTPWRRGDGRDRSQRARRRLQVERALVGARRRAKPDSDEASAARNSAALADAMEAYERTWGEHQRRLKAIEPLEADEARVSQLSDRLDQLRALLRDRFQTFSSLPTAVLSDLPALISRHSSLKELRDKVQAHAVVVAEAVAAAELLASELEPLESAYGKLSADFPLNLQRWQVLGDSLKAAEQEAATLLSQLEAKEAEGATYRRFGDVGADYQARLGALAVQEDEDAARLSQVEGQLTLVLGLSSAHADLRTQIRDEFDQVSATFPDDLRELDVLRGRLQALEARLAPIQARLQEARDGQPVLGDWISTWPEDFPARLKQWRGQQRTAQRLSLLKDANAAELRQSQVAAIGLAQQLATFEGLQDQSEGFPERLEDWLRSRQELHVEMEAWQGLQERIESFRTVVENGKKRYAGVGDNYLERLDALRTRQAELGQKQEQLQHIKSEKARLQGELTGLQQKLQMEYGDLAQGPQDLPGRLQEYHRLHQVAADLKLQDEALKATQDELESRLATRYMLEQAAAEIRIKADEGRGHDETFHLMLVRLERDAQARRQTEAALEALPDGGDSARLQGRLDVLPTVEDTLGLRAAILGLVASHLEGTGLSVGTVEYLEYQALKAEIQRVSDTRARLLHRSDVAGKGSTSDLVRIADKLDELVRLLGEDVVRAPLEATLLRYEEMQALRDSQKTLAGEMQALGGEAAIDKDSAVLRKQIEKEKKRLHLAESDEVEQATARYQEYQGAHASMAALQALVRSRWSSDSADGLNLDKLKQHVASLETGLGGWAVQSLDQVAELKTRWRVARTMHSELQGLQERIGRIEALGSDDSGLEGMETTLDVPDVDADDDGYVTAWQEWRAFIETLRQLEAERLEVLESSTEDGEVAATLLDGLRARQVALEEKTGSFASALDVEAVIALFEVDLSNRSDLRDLEQKLEGLPPELELVAAALELHERRTQRREALGLEPHDDVPAVLVAYRRHQELQEERRTLQRLVAARQPAIGELRARLHELTPLLGGRHQDTSVPEELVRWQAFQDGRSRSQQVQKRVHEVRQEADRLGASRRRLEAEMRAVELQLPGGSVDDLLSDYPAYLEVQKELEELRRKLSAQPSLAMLRRQLIELQTEVEAIVAPPPDLAERLAELRLDEAAEPRRVQALERASELLEELSNEQWNRATVETDGTVWLWAQGDGRSPLSEGPSWLSALWQLAVLEELGDVYPWPLVFDEPFAAMDARARGLMRDRMQELGRHRQLIVITEQTDVLGSDHLVADLLEGV